jgi:hypothetical protein
VGQFDKLLAGYDKRADKSNRPGGLEPCTLAALGLALSIVFYMTQLMAPLVVAACLALCGAGFARATKMSLLSAMLNLLILLVTLTLLAAAIVPEIARRSHESAPATLSG